MEPQIIIGHGVVSDGVGLLIEDGAMLIRGGKIEQVGKADEVRAEGAEFIDVGGRVVLPGLLNPHHHLYSALATGLAPLGETNTFTQILENLWWPLDLALDEESIYCSALAGLMESVKHGVTMIFDHHASMGYVWGSLAVLERAFALAGVKGMLCLETSDRMGTDRVEAQIEENLSPAAGIETRPTAAASRKTRPTAMAGMGTRPTGLIRRAFGLHANFTLCDETLGRIGRAKPAGMPIHVHCGEDRADLAYCLAHGYGGPVERLHRFGLLDSHSILAHAVHLSEADYRLIDEVGPVVVSNPESNANNRVGRMDRRRIKHYVLGTDGMSPDMVGTLRSHYLLGGTIPFAEMKEAFFTHRYALQAQFFPGTGGLAPGMRADLAVLDYVPVTPLSLDNLLGHLLFGVRGGKVYMTVADGKVLWRNGELTFVDEEEVTRRVARAAKALHERYYRAV